MKEQYESIIVSKLPNDIIAVFARIRKDTANWTNKAFKNAHKQNFERLMELVKLKFSSAIKTANKVVENTKKQLLESKIKGFKTALKFAKGEQKNKLEAKIKGFEAALKFVK